MKKRFFYAHAFIALLSLGFFGCLLMLQIGGAISNVKFAIAIVLTITAGFNSAYWADKFEDEI